MTSSKLCLSSWPAEVWLVPFAEAGRLAKGPGKVLSRTAALHALEAAMRSAPAGLRQFACESLVVEPLLLARLSDHELGGRLRWAVESGQLAVVSGRATGGGGGGGGAPPKPKPPDPPPDPPKPPQPVKEPWSLVALTYVANIAPGKETPKPKIAWTLKDPSVAITGGKLEVFRTRDPADAAPIWTRNLAGNQIREGDRELEWAGEIDAHADFPDAHVTIEYSPYTIKLTITDGGREETKEAKFKVIVADVEVVLDSKAVLTDAKDIALYDVLTAAGGLPGAGNKREVRLVSNLFKTSSAEMGNTNNASFTQYKTLWGDGPRIPLLAKVWIKNSAGAKVLAPKAWGKRRVVWDWECVTPDLSRLHAAAKSYCETSQDYDAAVSKPTGVNAHKDRGGKRGDAAARVYSPDAGGGAYPYKVTAGAKRTWSGLGEPARAGAEEGLSGAIFRPARMAGDAYKLTAYFDPAPKQDLDVEGALKAAFVKELGTFEIWREIHLAKYIKKTAAIPGFGTAAVQGYYEKAYIRVEDKTGGVETMAKAAYDTAFTAAIAAQPAIVKEYAIDAAISQYDGGAHAVTYRSHAAMRSAYIQKIKADMMAADPTLTDPAATTAATAQVDAALTAQGLATPADHATTANDWSLEICRVACGIYMAAAEGVTIIQFDGTDNLVPLANSRTNGYAPAFATSGRSRCAFIQYASSYTGNSNTMEQTISHEVGHHMFMPHAPLPAASLPGGAQADAHDKDDLHCLMGYDYTAERKFCGKCLLRMRGWDHSKLDKDRTKNKKP